MSKLKILQYGHPLLRQKAMEIKKVGTREKELFAAMGETMYAANGIGLAATQVGVMERLFVLDVDQERDKKGDPDLASRNLQIFINPEIVWESEDDMPFEEGCLSIPDVQRDIYRPSAITIRALDENFEPFELEADELLARVIQHELDHLDGVLFVDRLSQFKRAMIAGELNKIKSETQRELDAFTETYPVTVD